MGLVSLELARKHLRSDSDGDDELLMVYIAAAEQAAIEYMDRDVYPDADDLAAAVAAGTAGEAPMVVNDAIKAAVLLTIGHLDANREDVVVGATVAELPRGVRSLLQPYRVGMGA